MNTERDAEMGKQPSRKSMMESEARHFCRGKDPPPPQKLLKHSCISEGGMVDQKLTYSSNTTKGNIMACSKELNSY
jgi:hypothetical protein